MAFQYRARDPLGNLREGELDAASLDDASELLRRDGLQLLQLDEVDEATGEGLFPRRVSRQSLMYTTSQLAIMVETGITLSSALDGLVRDERNPTLKRILNELKTSVEGGEDFSEALARYPKLFDKTFVSLVKASEATGSLGEMLDRITDYLRKDLETRSKVRAAMAYPAIMMVVATAVTIFLLTYILPKFTPLFNSRGMKLPMPTVIMMTVSHWLLDFWYLWLLGITAAVVGFGYGRRTVSGRLALDWIKINLPLIGPLCRKVTISRCIRTLGTMVASGVSVLDALRLCADVSGNVFYEKLWLGVLERVTCGQQICDVLSGTKLLPPMLVQMISSGEQTGKLDLVLERVSSYYDHEVETSIKTATSMIEPIMITIMGVVVGGIGMALMLPIFQLSKVH